MGPMFHYRTVQGRVGGKAKKVAVRAPTKRPNANSSRGNP